MYVLLKIRKAYGLMTEDQGSNRKYVCSFFHSSRNGLLDVRSWST